MALPVLECIDFVSDVGWDWLVLVGVGGRATPAHPRKDGTSHQICSNGRFGSDLV
ncbi:nucleosidase [Corynebacterium diphtheriae]|nr:nucleosidase [Corynebacterium diphtheriae]